MSSQIVPLKENFLLMTSLERNVMQVCCQFMCKSHISRTMRKQCRVIKHGKMITSSNYTFRLHEWYKLHYSSQKKKFASIWHIFRKVIRSSRSHRVEKKGAVGQGHISPPRENLVGCDCRRCLIVRRRRGRRRCCCCCTSIRHAYTNKRIRQEGGGACVRGAERDSVGTAAIRLSKYLMISSVALCTAEERDCVNGYVTIIRLTTQLRMKANERRVKKLKLNNTYE